ncbi:major facilitator superfamily transporter [Ophiostoma piceae UAMH 11346]|uniref:Major facilitator superfamily transporter n=1 Tax=Ophiostoma piceae (strain UAMH 11346) TaxID=1262450 RepID=S3C9Y2_OPHP1|nr:major facilitator superfamily transporter [Ophiostoma piceae UAMH 11346]
MENVDDKGGDAATAPETFRLKDTATATAMTTSVLADSICEESAAQPSPSTQLQTHPKTPESTNVVVRCLKKLDYVPARCQWDPESPPSFGWGLCLLFTLAGMFTVSNLYYNHPILNVLAKEFDVSYETASQVPTLMQAGYALGLTGLAPLADIVRRRPLTLTLVFVTAAVWLGLCLTRSFIAFRILSFLVAITTVTPQLMLPLVAELAPVKRRAMMISVIFGGIFMGLLFARIISGIVTEYTSFRTIYFVALGIQYLLFVLLFFLLPDYPSVNPEGISYFRMLYSMVHIAMRQPLLVQMSIIGFFMNAAYVGYWTTLTFLLSSPPFNLNTLDIGLFALIGMPPFFINPHLIHHLTKYLHTSYAYIIGLMIAMIGIFIGTFVGTFSLAGPIVMGILIDMGLILSQTGCRTRLVTIEPKARNRVNTIFMVSSFSGMLMGTSVCNKLYATGGWHYSGYAGIAFIVAALVIGLARGPHEMHWVGYRGGWGMYSSLDKREPEVTGAATAASDEEKAVKSA